jgi:DNA-binding transcriptional MerR regulator
VSSNELVKLYYRIGEVASIVGVQPHVLRYWETEFRTIRPQKSHKGQRVYSRRDVEKLLRVKDLLKNQGFTIAGAKRKLREPEPKGSSDSAAPAVALLEAVSPVKAEQEPETPPASALVAALAPKTVGVTPRSPVPLRPEVDARRMRHAVLTLREDIASMLEDLERAPRRPKLPSAP